MNLAAIALALALSAEVGPVTMWTGDDPSGACRIPTGGARVVQTSAGKVFACVGGTWVNRSTYNMVFFFPDRMSNGQTLARVIVPRAFTVPQNCSGSLAGPGTNATGTTVVTVKRNGSTFASISIATSGTATWTCSSATTLAVGDVLTVVGPATADATMADLSITLAGVL